MLRSSGDWIALHSGRRFWPLSPDWMAIQIGDIAAGLSKLCRYGGHCLRFYSVAEHCVLMAGRAPHHLRRQMLLHDAPEGLGLVDLPSPVKRQFPAYRDAEKRLMRAVATRFELPWPLDPLVAEFDARICLDERDQGMAPLEATNEEWMAASPVMAHEPLGVTLQFWSPKRAEWEYTLAFNEAGRAARGLVA